MTGIIAELEMEYSDPYVPTVVMEDERDLWSDAYLVLVVGDFDVRVVQRCYNRHQRKFPKDHVALSAIRNWLEFTRGVGNGPTLSEHERVTKIGGAAFVAISKAHPGRSIQLGGRASALAKTA